MSERGYAAIALHNSKNPHNVGGVFRAAGCFNADLIVVGGKRRMRALGGLAADTQKAWRHTPLLTPDDVMSTIPFNAIPIAVDLVEGAVELANFVHPERAYYIFGPEDGTLGSEIVERCKHRVMIPTSFCLNLAATVNVVLYDRQAKQRHARILRGVAA
ncbi:MAG: RNA methyltransferase [Gluconobacter sp.]